MQRMTRSRCPCHSNHWTHNYSMKDHKKKVKQDEKKVFRKRWTSSFFVKQKDKKVFFFILTDKRTCCHVLRKEGKHEESELERVRERTHGDDDKHSLAGVPRAVCVTHKSLCQKKHTTAAKPCLKTISQGILLGWFSSINSDLRSCSKTRQEKTFFRPCGPLSPLLSLIYFDDVFCLLPSDLLHLKNVRKIRIKTKIWKKEKIFCHEHFDFEEQVNRRNQQKQLEKNKRVKGRHWKKKIWEVKRGEKRRKMGWCNACPGAEINDKWVQIDLTRSTTSRHAAMVKRDFNRARDPQRVRILKSVFFCSSFLSGILFCWRKFKWLKTILCCM